MTTPYTVALVGNSNAGTTTLFNALTGAQNPVANYARVTTEVTWRDISHRGVALRIVDVPGLQSITSRSPEDRAGCDYLHEQEPDLIVNVLDAGRLDRSLFLTTQLIESGLKYLLVLNMMDEVERNGIRIDIDTLASALESPVVATCGVKKQGVAELLDAIVDALQAPARGLGRLQYDTHLEEAIVRIQGHLEQLHPREMGPAHSRWLAINLLEGNDRMVRAEANHEPLLAAIQRECAALAHEHDEDTATLLATARFAFAHGLLRMVRTRFGDPSVGSSPTRILDDIFLNRVLGLPLLLGILWVMFETTFSLGAVPTDWIKAGVEAFSAYATATLPEGMFKDLVINGVIAGVGGTIVFLPNIVILFFFMAILSGTGYLVRASFLMDLLMHKIGLHGATLIPMVAGFGCNVPAVMATRVITSKRARLIAILIAPFMNCSARLPVFILFAGAFFSDIAGTVVFAIYMASIGAAMLSAVILNQILRGSGGDAFVMELPPYRLPTLHSVLHHMWDSAQGFIAKVTGVILIGSIVIWFLQEFPKNPVFSQDFDTVITQVKAQPEGPGQAEALRTLQASQAREKLEQSYLGRISIAVAPIFEPLGFSWRETASILTGFVAKEVVVATYAVIYAQEKGSEGLTMALRTAMPVSTAIAFMIFTLLYAPCLATIATIQRETKSWGWAGFSVGYSMLFAWMMALLASRVGAAVL